MGETLSCMMDAADWAGTKSRYEALRVTMLGWDGTTDSAASP